MEFLARIGLARIRHRFAGKIGQAIVCTLAAALAGCGSVRIERTAHGVAHIEATDYRALAYGVAYAHAGDNVCQTANHLVTIRGERSRYFGPDRKGLLGLKVLPNEQIDIFVRAHMDDPALGDAARSLSDEARRLARGYVEGYNRYLRDHRHDLPGPCAGAAWVQPMTDAEYLRLQELTMVQIGSALLADAIVAAAPPAAGAARSGTPGSAEAAAALSRYALDERRPGSNGWAFGSRTTGNGRGLLLGNPHFPWAGVNRFWQMHLTIPRELDVMGASIGHTAVVQIGFNRDVAWTHTVSTGRRITLHELELVDGEPTSYRVDGREERMTPEIVAYDVRDDTGGISRREHTIWRTRFGPVVTIPDAGLRWDSARAYAVQDVNALNLRALDVWIGFNRAKSVANLEGIMARLGIPWVNTIAADRHGEAMYADVSAVPDVDADHLRRCAPSEPAAGLFETAGLVVLDGSRSECDWQRDPDSPVPGLTPIDDMPVAVRRDWVQNSNDSYWLTNPAIDWDEMSPLIGPTEVPQSLRTRAGLAAIRERLAASDGIAAHGRVGLDEAQAMLLANRNHAARLVLDDFLAICDDAATTPGARDGCAVLADWDRRAELESRGAHLFREWWRSARGIEGVWRVPFDPAEPVGTPRGLRTVDPAIRSELLAALERAVATVRDAGFALDAPLGDLQRPASGAEVRGLHGGPEFEGLLNKLEARPPGLGPNGYPIDFGTSYVQAVTFDDRGPVARGLLSYGQSPDRDSPYYFDQLPAFAAKEWPELPFHRDDVSDARIGPVLVLSPD